jgi:hypothetical protein
MTSVHPASAEAVTHPAMRQDRRGRPGPECDEALCRQGLREVGGAVELIDLGYARYVLRAAVDGDLKPGATSVKAGKLGDCRSSTAASAAGAPFIFTKDNINNFDF